MTDKEPNPLLQVAHGKRALVAIAGASIGDDGEYFALALAVMASQVVFGKFFVSMGLDRAKGTDVERWDTSRHAGQWEVTHRSRIFRSSFCKELNKRVAAKCVFVTNLSLRQQEKLLRFLMESESRGQPYLLPDRFYDLHTLLDVANFDVHKIQYLGDPKHPQDQASHCVRVAMAAIRYTFEIEQVKDRTQFVRPVVVPQVQVSIKSPTRPDVKPIFKATGPNAVSDFKIPLE